MSYQREYNNTCYATCTIQAYVNDSWNDVSNSFKYKYKGNTSTTVKLNTLIESNKFRVYFHASTDSEMTYVVELQFYGRN